MADSGAGTYGSVSASDVPQVRERRHTGSPANLETVPLLQDQPLVVDRPSINAGTPEPIVQTQPRRTSAQDWRRETTFREKDLAWIKDEENCPGHLMTYINNEAEKYKNTKQRYKHYGLMVFVLNTICCLCCGFPFALPFMILATMSSHSVRNLNEQNDFVSSRACRCCVITNVIFTIIAGLIFQLGFCALVIFFIVSASTASKSPYPPSL